MLEGVSEELYGRWKEGMEERQFGILNQVLDAKCATDLQRLIWDLQVLMKSAQNLPSLIHAVVFMLYLLDDELY